MSNVYLVLAILCVALPSLPPQGVNGWRGLTPLRSTRTEVERLLGPPERTGNVSIYRTGDETVQVAYARSPCKGDLLGWNVPADTVLQITVIPRKKESFAELKLDKSRFIRARGHVAGNHHINLEEGLRYEVSPDGNIHTVSYIPSSKDGHLRCPGFPAYDGEATRYRPYDTYGGIPTSNEDARLDNFAIALENDPNSKGYILVYAGQRSRPGEAKKRAERARKYIISRGDIDEQRVVAVDGGYRESFEAEIYLVPHDMPAPVPKPTISLSEVQIIKNGSANEQ